MEKILTEYEQKEVEGEKIELKSKENELENK